MKYSVGIHIESVEESYEAVLAKVNKAIALDGSSKVRVEISAFVESDQASRATNLRERFQKKESTVPEQK